MDVILATLFALVAGAGTALSPCVLPVLPLALSGAATGGRRRPLGIAVGLAAAFAFTTLALAYVIDAFGLPDDALRVLAIVVMLGFGMLGTRTVPGPASSTNSQSRGQQGMGLLNAPGMAKVISTSGRLRRCDQKRTAYGWLAAAL